MENIRAAWKQDVDAEELAAIYKLTQSLGLYYQMQSQYQEAQAAQLQAFHKLEHETPSEEVDITLAVILVDMGWVGIRYGQLREAESALN